MYPFAHCSLKLPIPREMEMQKAPRGVPWGHRGRPSAGSGRPVLCRRPHRWSPADMSLGLALVTWSPGDQPIPSRAPPLAGSVRRVDIHPVLHCHSLKDMTLLPALQLRGFRNHAPSTQSGRGLMAGNQEPCLASLLPSAGVSPPLPWGGRGFQPLG